MTHIQQRRDIAANWSAEDPVLRTGEVGWERDTLRAKLGDGVTAWSSLDYIVTGDVTSVAGKTGDVTLTPDDVGLGTLNDDLAAKAPIDSPDFIGDPTAPTPAVGDNDQSIATTAFVKDALLAVHPVGSIYMSTTNTNPGDFIGGTWEAWGSGRVPVGVDSADSDFDTADTIGGEKEHTLTTAEIPTHNHGDGTLGTSSDGNHDHDYQWREDASTLGPQNRIAAAGGASGTNVTKKVAYSNGDHSHDVQGNTGSTGDGEAHNNLPPYITCYMFRRTA